MLKFSLPTTWVGRRYIYQVGYKTKQIYYLKKKKRKKKADPLLPTGSLKLMHSDIGFGRILEIGQDGSMTFFFF